MEREIEKWEMAYRKNRFIPRLILISVAALVLTGTVLTVNFLVKKYIHNSDTVTAIKDSWQNHNYEKTYEIASRIIERKSLHNTARIYRGYSAFYLAISQTDSLLSQSYMETAINDLRVASLNSKKSLLPQLYYMLGKSYFYKNTISSYIFYADLAVKYLTLAQESGYKATDISELLGLSYSALGMTQESISSFTEALLERESDTLLLSIGEQYYKNGQGNIAKQYLARVRELTKNDDFLDRSSFLLGMISYNEKNYTDAEKEFLSILDRNENSADAHYGLGLVYKAAGDTAKARAELRKANKLQGYHDKAEKELELLNKKN